MTDDAATEALPVLIIGSGLGGLTLANTLLKFNIPYRVFERDAQSAQRAQGYRISIDGGGHSGADGLAVALTPDLFEEFEGSCGEVHHPGGRVDARSGVVLGKGFLGLITAGGPWMITALLGRYVWKRAEKWGWEGWKKWWSIVPPNTDKRYPVDRRVLRSILLRTQNDHITYSSPFSSYSVPESNTHVTAHFANGTSVNGSLLVGADGVRSKVARQLIGELAEPSMVGMRCVYGKTVVTPELEEQLHETLKHGASFVVDKAVEGGGKLTLVMEAMRFHHAIAPQDYIFWALAGRDEVFQSKGGNETEDGVKVSQRLTRDWHPSIKVIMDRQTPADTASLPIRSSNTDGTIQWDTNRRVTVLGDAIHCMPPTGGQGANSAMYDAALLGMVLRDSGEDGKKGWGVETLRRYEEGMRYNVGDVVGMAVIGAQRLLG